MPLALAVENSSSVTNNGGDTTPPTLSVELPELIKGEKLSVNGSSENGVGVKLYVNGALAYSTTAGAQGLFNFQNVALRKDKENNISVEAVDNAGNKAVFNGIVISDATRPILKLEELTDWTDKNTVDVKGSISEVSNYEILVNERSSAQGEGNSFSESVSVIDGANKIKVVVKDKAGWESSKEVEVSADTKPVNVRFEIEKGNEYYQGRAVSNINGETKPNANLYLYIYRPLGTQYNPKFDQAVAKVTADSSGKFTFSNVNFERQPINLESLAPKEVPQGLKEYSLFPVEQIKEQQTFSYYVFVIAEDKSGKSAYQQAMVTLNSCYSGDWDFDVQSIAAFQAPLRLNPQLLDEGREQVSAVFNFSYRGKGMAKVEGGREIEGKFQIQGVEFDKACTQSMLEDPKFKLGCTIFPQGSRKRMPNGDKSAWYVTYDLHSAEKLSEKKESYWNEFKKRQIVLPMKIRISYQERDSTGKFGPTKTQTSCTDLGYFVDIPIDSKNMLPDIVTNQGMQAINFTVDKINKVLPYLEKAIMVTGVGCISSFLGRMATRYARIGMSKMEYIMDKFQKKDDEKDKKCPPDNYKYVLEGTVNNWNDNKVLFDNEGINSPFDQKRYVESKENGEFSKNKYLNNLCPQTAALWNAEEKLDLVYKWSCDRVFCRAVPAKWTGSEDKDKVDTSILSQSQCTAASRGVPLRLVENCQEHFEKNKGVSSINPNTNAKEMISKGAFNCYYNPIDSQYYYINEAAKEDIGEGSIVRLQPLTSVGSTIAQAFNNYELFAYRAPNSKEIIVGVDKTCDAVCSVSRQGYKADKNNGTESYYNGIKKNYGCYKEVRESSLAKDVKLQGKNGHHVSSSEFSAGYTRDCFVDMIPGSENIEGVGHSCSDSGGCIPPLVCISGNCTLPMGAPTTKLTMKNIDDQKETGLLQCVCTQNNKAEAIYGARTAVKAIGDYAETWDYMQDQVFNESGGKFGTYYPKWRYYSGRDFPSAFGMNAVTEILSENKTIHEVNPSTQYLGAYQTVCLSRIRAQLLTLKSILEGLRNCIYEAKYTGLHDNGVCKTLFSQHVCGLVYKVISYFSTGCSPYSFGDQLKGDKLGVAGELFQAGTSSIGEAMQSSIDDIKEDYGNAKINQFFATGAQGFTQSICMAAFGYDWPMGMDFILDAAYSVPGKTTAMAVPAERELATFNPASGTATYNYNVAAMIIPGCEIKSYNVYLKCVGQEDNGHPNLECGKQGCDCLNTIGTDAFDSEKIKYLERGRGFNLKQNDFVSVPIPSPQKVDSHYRYDHVVIEVQLAQGYTPDTCFDEGYKDGKFYSPIIDISPPALGVCQVQYETGRYYCPEIVNMFGGGSGAYLEDPFITCYDKRSGGYVDCDTPNLFIAENRDELKFKIHYATDGKQYCLKTSLSGIYNQNIPTFPQLLPQGMPGSSGSVLNLGAIDESFFSATGTFTLADLSRGSCSNIGFNWASAV